MQPFNVEAVRSAPHDAAPHRTFNVDEDEDDVTHGGDAVQHQPGGDTVSVIYGVLAQSRGLWVGCSSAAPGLVVGVRPPVMRRSRWSF